MRRPALKAAAARAAAVTTLALVCAGSAAPAFAHEGDPRYESLVTRVDGIPGLRAEILNGDDRLLLIHTGSRPVVVEGYEEEPYVRFLPGGTVQVNRRSEASYLNSERDGQVDVPAFASTSPTAAPVWRTVARTGRYEFHDHRIHWMAGGVPPAVRDDRTTRRRVFDWAVPVRSGATAGAVRGTLWWRGESGGIGPAALGGMGALVLASLVGSVWLQRRRSRRAEPAPASEAW